MILKIAYGILTLCMILILILIGRESLQKTHHKQLIKKKKFNLIIFFLMLWVLYSIGLASTGILKNYDFPPRFVLLQILPAFLFTGLFLYKNRNNNWIQNIPSHWLSFYQSFRIVIESLFVFTVAEGILHKNVTMEGYNYDILFGLSAIIIGYLHYKNKISKRIIIIWNYLGLGVITIIIFLFFTTIYFPTFYGSETQLMPMEFLEMPFNMVPAFLMPSAVFIHVLAIIQLTRK